MKVQMNAEDENPTDELEEEFDDELVEFADEEDDDFDDAEEASDESEDDEDPEVEITYQPPEGKSFEKKMKYSELGRKLWESENREAIDQNVNKYIESTMPLVNEVNNSEILGHILHYKKQGYTEEQIKEGLTRIWSEEIGKKTKYETYDDEIRDKTAKELEFRLKPMEEKLKGMEEKRVQDEVTRNNNMVLDKALATHGVNRALTQKEQQALISTLQGIYPGADLTRIMLTEKTADVIVKSNLVGSTSKGKQSATKAITSRAKIPPVLAGRGGIKTTARDVKGREDTSPKTLEQRIKAKEGFFK